MMTSRLYTKIIYLSEHTIVQTLSSESKTRNSEFIKNKKTNKYQTKTYKYYESIHSELTITYRKRIEEKEKIPKSHTSAESFLAAVFFFLPMSRP